MNWQLTWFFANILFVGSLIIVLFLHRSVDMAKLQQESHQKIQRIKATRTTLWILTALFFIAMCGAFLADMHYNGT